MELEGGQGGRGEGKGGRGGMGGGGEGGVRGCEGWCWGRGCCVLRVVCRRPGHLPPVEATSAIFCLDHVEILPVSLSQGVGHRPQDRKDSLLFLHLLLLLPIPLLLLLLLPLPLPLLLAIPCQCIVVCPAPLLGQQPHVQQVSPGTHRDR